ncbi:MAG: ABC transporter ATP-binding protein [Pseudomonadota bacterium]
MLLQVRDVIAGYGNKQVLHQISLDVGDGEIVALLGHNGAGKTTTLNCIFGLSPITGGNISFNGTEITNRNTIHNVKQGISMVTQGRGLFAELSVLDNLKLGGYTLGREVEIRERLEDVYALFPVLKERGSQLAGTLSGGEQQMLAIGISLIIRPKLLLMDEPSLGLSPLLVQNIIQNIKKTNEQFGSSVLLVEQNLEHALSIANRAYVMKMGKIILEEKAEVMASREDFWDLF